MLALFACLIVADIELAFAGDVMFGRYGQTRYRPSDGQAKQVFASIAPALKSDFTIINLETPIDADMPMEPPRPGKNRFGARPDTVAALAGANVQAVSMANNHAYDLGPERMLESKAALRKHDLQAFGVPGEAALTEERIGCEEVQIPGGPRACLIAVSGKSNVFHVPRPWPKVPYARMWRLRRVLPPIVREAAQRFPLVIVFIHWGEEYTDRPTAEQRKTAHALVDAGARLVIGHHPHVTQGLERYRQGLIAYSLGNLLFDRSRHNTRDGAILRVRVDAQSQVIGAKVLPTRIVHKPNAVLLNAGKEADRPLARMMRLSRALGTRLDRVDDALVLGGTFLAKKID